jgi:hypothetical protein
MSKSKYVIPVSIVAAVILVLTVFGLIPPDVVVRLEFLRSLTRESPKTPTLIKQVTVNPSAYGTTLHNVTVGVHGDKYVIKIDPLSLSALYDLFDLRSRVYSLSTTDDEDSSGCSTCDYITQGCNLESSEGEFTVLDVKVLYENETHAHLQVEYTRNGVTRTALIEHATLWNYTEVQNEVEKTGTSIYINVLDGVNEGIPEHYEYYVFTYSISHANYALFIGTSLISLGEETYASTLIWYVLNETSESASLNSLDVEADSLSLIYIHSPVTLSQHYSILAVVAEELVNIYVTSGFNKLAEKYRVLETTLSELAELVRSELAEYDVVIQESTGTIATHTWSEETAYALTLWDILGCLMPIMKCLYGLIRIRDLIWTCKICLQVYFCLPACFNIFTKLTCLLCILTGIVHCLLCAKNIYDLVNDCYQAGRCLRLW